MRRSVGHLDGVGGGSCDVQRSGFQSLVTWIALSGLLGCVGASVGADVPPLSIDDIAPEGIRGAMLLCGRDCTPAAIREVISHQDESRPLTILEVGSGEPLLGSDETDSFGPLQHCDQWGTVETVSLPEKRPRTIWIHGAALPTELAVRAKLDRWLDRICDDETWLVVSGDVIPEMCAWVATSGPNAGPVQLSRGLGRLPGVIWRPANSMRNANRAAPLNAPGWLQLTLHPQEMLLVRGRQMIAPAAEQGRTVFRIYAAEQTSLDTIAIDADQPTDFTQLRRIAVSRNSPPFPPAERRTPRVEQGSLVIVGGGRIPDEILDRFVELSGGPASQIVVIPTASDGEHPERHQDVERLRAAGAGQVTTLHTRDRSLANSAEFLAPLTQASGVWFTGGRQWRLVDAYEETPLVAACHAVLERGGAIGGSSAGATIQGDYLVRGHPLGNTVMMAAGYERGFAFLPGTAIDQHFTQRKREADLEAVKRRHPQLVCLGIDEGTALVVQGTSGEVLGAGSVTLYDGEPDADDPQAVLSRSVLQPGERYDFDAQTAHGRGDAPPPDPAQE
ncbi:MAG: cyanophycinase [Planctomycetaceae bacterium]|nr:cyanophycinase [Planctomycetaceae bacterium]